MPTGGRDCVPRCHLSVWRPASNSKPQYPASSFKEFWKPRPGVRASMWAISRRLTAKTTVEKRGVWLWHLPPAICDCRQHTLQDTHAAPRHHPLHSRCAWPPSFTHFPIPHAGSTAIKEKGGAGGEGGKIQLRIRLVDCEVVFNQRTAEAHRNTPYPHPQYLWSETLMKWVGTWKKEEVLFVSFFLKVVDAPYQNLSWQSLQLSGNSQPSPFVLCFNSIYFRRLWIKTSSRCWWGVSRSCAATEIQPATTGTPDYWGQITGWQSSAVCHGWKFHLKVCGLTRKTGWNPKITDGQATPPPLSEWN